MIDYEAILAIEERIKQVGRLDEFEPEIDTDDVAQIAVEMFDRVLKKTRGLDRVERNIQIVGEMSMLFYLGWEAHAALETERLVG